MAGKHANMLFHRLADYSNPASFGSSMRRRRFARFLNVLRVQESHTILDVGGIEETWLGSGLESQVTVLNPVVRQGKRRLRHVKGDGCNMADIATKSFDIVFSNSVIEHVGERVQQERFASEIRRVGLKYWVQTPYRYFPLEPHFLFPFFNCLTPALQREVAVKWRYSHLRRNNQDVLDELARLAPLVVRDVRELFPDAQVIKESLAGLTKSIIAYRE